MSKNSSRIKNKHKTEISIPSAWVQVTCIILQNRPLDRGQPARSLRVCPAMSSYVSCLSRNGHSLLGSPNLCYHYDLLNIHFLFIICKKTPIDLLSSESRLRLSRPGRIKWFRGPDVSHPLLHTLASSLFSCRPSLIVSVYASRSDAELCSVQSVCGRPDGGAQTLGWSE